MEVNAEQVGKVVWECGVMRSGEQLPNLGLMSFDHAKVKVSKSTRLMHLGWGMNHP